MTTYLIQKGDASKRLPDLRSPTSVLKVDGLSQHQVQNGHQLPTLISVNLRDVDLKMNIL